MIPLSGVAQRHRSSLSVVDEAIACVVANDVRVSINLELALVLAHETGHRIGSIRLLKWSDIDVEHKTVLWRGESDKIGFEHETLLTPVALRALQRARADRMSIGDAWILPSPGDPTRPCSRHLLRNWWKRGEQLAGLKRVRGLGWHSLRRKFATELKHAPLKDRCYLGGWKDPQTLLKCYQRPDEATMREALASRGRLEESGDSGANRHHESTPSAELQRKRSPA